MPEEREADRNSRTAARLRSFAGRALRPEWDRRQAQSVVDSLREQNERLLTRTEQLRDRNQRLRDEKEQLENRNAQLQGRSQTQREARQRVRHRISSHAPHDERRLEEDASARSAYERVLELLTVDGDFGAAAVRMTRALLAHRGSSPARSFAQLVQHQTAWSMAGDVCVALVVQGDPMPATAWRLFSRSDPPFVLRVAATEYFRAAFRSDPAAAVARLEAIRRGESEMVTDGQAWLAIAQLCFGAQREELSRWALQRAADLVRPQLATAPGAEPEPPAILGDIHWLQSWLDRPRLVPAELAPGEVPIGVLRLRHPDRAETSTDPHNYFETLGLLGQLARYRDLRFAGPWELVSFAGELRADLPADRAISGPEARVRLYEVDRDASSYSSVPDGTWLLVSGELPQEIFGLRTELPFDSRFRPIFLSVHVDRPLLLNTEVLDHLRRYAPVGCRDWRTVALLQAASVPAFFAGAVSLLLDDAVPAAAERLNTASATTLTDMVCEARALIQDLRSGPAAPETTNLQTYLAARAVGADVEFRPPQPSDPRLDGLTELDDAAVSRMRDDLATKLGAVLGAITAGASETEVYERWRSVCASAVEGAQAWRHDMAPIPAPDFDVAQSCADVRLVSVTAQRSQPGPPGDEIAVEFSLDANYEHQLAVVLDSIVSRCSRPLRAFVLCRELGPTAFTRFAALFPTVSFVWLPMDEIDYGPISGMIEHITVSTMDRLLLPDLLPELDRIVHHDLDALCLGDLAELFDLDLAGNPLAARTNPTPNFGSGFLSVIKYARRLNDPALASELIRRTHLLHDFDYEVFNAGILVLDLERMRADEFTRYYLPFAQRFGMNDQSVLNVYAGPHRAALAPRWNQFPRNEVVDDDTVILHWLGTGKPWRRTYIGAREFWVEAERQLAAREMRLANLISR